MKLNLILFVLTVSPALAKHIQLLDITPEEAQKLITQQSLDLRYSKKLSEAPAAGQSYNGKIIDGDDYTAEIYEANQFHGQDGLGRYIFGYTDNQQARLEARNVNGEVRGQYRYIDPFGNDIEVQYWSDSLGYHQTDNRPQYDLQPVTETPEVRKAREEHERLWKEAARMNGVDVDSNGLFNANVAETNYDEEELEGQVSNQHQSLTRYPHLPYAKHLSDSNAKEFGRVEGDSVVVEAAPSSKRFARQQAEVETATSEPRGFFYSFDYPVPFIRGRQMSFEEQQPTSIVEQIVDDSANIARESQTREARHTEHISENVHDQVADDHVQLKKASRGRGTIKFKHTTN